jgi:hypothetical protein
LRIQRTVLAAVVTLVASGLLGGIGAAIVQRYSPPPAAVVAQGSDEAFVTGLQERENPPRSRTIRWMGRRAAARFLDFPNGVAAVEVAVHGHRHDVLVSANGVSLGVLPPGINVQSFPMHDTRATSVDVELVTETFEAGGGRKLGALLDRVSVVPRPSFRPSFRLMSIFILVACGFGIATLALGFRTGPALALALVAVTLLGAALWPNGLFHTGYAWRVASVLLVAALFAWGLVTLCARRQKGAVWAVLGILATFFVHGVVSMSACLVPTDAVFHAHRLLDVVKGNWFLVSVTQHAPPFRIPYGVTFYALLTPFANRPPLEYVELVRWGAAIAQILSGLILFVLMARKDLRRAGITLLILQLLPGSLIYYAYGNLSNVFGQAVTTIFFAWWAIQPFGGWAMGALLIVLGGLAHLSSFFVMAALTTCLLIFDVRNRRLDRQRIIAVSIGFALVGAYYLSFTRLILDQLPRLYEGGHGRTSTGSVFQALTIQASDAFWQWGLPVLLLAFSWLIPTFSRKLDEGGDPLRSRIHAQLFAGLILAALAVFSPLEVRYIYALTIPLALMAGARVDTLLDRGRWAVILAGALIAAQAILAIFIEKGWLAALGLAGR